MLIVMPPTAYGRLGALLSALIVVCALIGLTLHRDVYNHVPRRDFYCYYTNVSNLLVLLYFALLAPQLYAGARLRRFIPVAEFSVMMIIMLTNVIFHTLLFPAIRAAAKSAPRSRETAIMAVDNLFVHYIVPWLTCLYWLLCSPGKNALTAWGALCWLTVPLLYLCQVFLRARHGNLADADTPYPYPFLDAGRLGAKRVALVCAALLMVGIACSLALLAGTHALYARFGGGHALALI